MFRCIKAPTKPCVDPFPRDWGVRPVDCRCVVPDGNFVSTQGRFGSRKKPILRGLGEGPVFVISDQLRCELVTEIRRVLRLYAPVPRKTVDFRKNLYSSFQEFALQVETRIISYRKTNFVVRTIRAEKPRKHRLETPLLKAGDFFSFGKYFFGLKYFLRV